MKKRTKINLSLLFLFLVPVFLNHAQPQSFFISPGQVIEDGKLVRGFCLEYSKDSLNDNNIVELKRITGNVLVTFRDGTSRAMTFEDLYLNERLIRISGYGSPQYVRMHLDNRVARVTVMETEGVVLAREKMSDTDIALVKANTRLVTEMIRNRVPHQAIQNAVWTNKEPSYSFNEATNTITVDFNTSPPERHLTGRYGGTAAVIFDHNTGEFRFDGLRADTSARTKALYDFITHFHSDHIDYRMLERILQNGLNSSLYFPLPMLDRSMRKRSFETMQSIVDTRTYQFDIQNFVCEILPVDVTSNVPVINSFIGQFFYSRYNFGDLIIEIYRHINPKTENMDGLIYRLQYQNVSQLILGDFDNEKALAELLQHSEENYIKRLEMLEELYALEEQLYNDASNKDDVNQRRSELRDQLQLLPTVMADIVKWPHHAHVFKNTALVEQLHRVINPRYFIYQAHHTQDEAEFDSFIRQFTFWEKFINSAKYRVNIISLELINIWRLS